MKAIRVSIYAIAACVVLLVLAGTVFALTFNPNRYKDEIERLVKDRTGRSLALRGNLEIAFWPSLGVKVNRVSLSERGTGEEFLSFDSAHASVALAPLLHGQAVVDGIRLSGLKARTVKEKDGRYNFGDLLEAKPPRERQATGPGAETKGAARSGLAFDIASIDIERSALSYVDQASGQEIALGDLKLATGRISERAEGRLQLKATAKGRKPDLDLRIELASDYRFDLPAKSFELSKLDAKLTGAATGISNLSANAKGDVAASPGKNEYRLKGLALDVKGMKDKQTLEAHLAAPELTIAASSAKGADLTAELRLKEAAREIEARLKLAGVEGSAKALVVPQLAAQLTMTAPGQPTLKLPVSGKLRADLEKQTASADLAAKFDGSSIQAKLALANFAAPDYQFDLDADRLDLDRYFPPQKKEVSAPSEKPAARPAAAQRGAQTDTPVDLSALKQLKASGRIRIGALQARGLKLANARSEVRAADGRLEAPHSASLYGGTMSGAVTAEACGRIAFKETLSGISIGPLLRDFAQKDALEGKGSVVIDVATAGKSVNAMKKALAGSARVQLKDGAIKGINLVEVFRRAKTALASQAVREEARQAQKTDFSELAASFTIKDGVAHNEDLDVKSPRFRVSGRGDIDLGNSRLDYVTKAAVVATTKGQGGEGLSRLSGLAVPVRLSGPFDQLAYQVDYSAAVAEFARSKAGERLRSRLEERLRGLFGR